MVFAAFGLAASAGLAQAQQAVQPMVGGAPILTRGGGIAGTSAGTGTTGTGTTAFRPPQVVAGVGHIGAGTGGTGLGMGNATGGIHATALGAGSGGVNDLGSLGSGTGGIFGTGRGLGAGAGGVVDAVNIGINTGGIEGTAIGSGIGGIADLNGYATGTGGINENNGIRFRVVQ
ncbi:MAG TPA: hypothetical protein VEQ16_02020 [Acidocella sp.]|nr:hypothetical protein [Acidocella sp.]